MFRPRIIPVLLLQDLGLVKTVKFRKPRYIGDPINAVKIFNDLEADELIFLDISAAKRNNSISIKFVQEVGEEAYMPFAVGGGLRNIEQVKECINNGAEKVVLDTFAVENPKLIKQCADFLGNQSVVVAIDAKKTLFGQYRVYTYNGSVNKKLDVLEWAQMAVEFGAGEILINSIDNDGMMNGFDLELIKKVSQLVSVPIIACGGAGEEKDFRLAVNYGAHAVAAGSMFVYHGARKAILINYPDKQTLLAIFR